MSATAVIVLNALTRDQFERDWHGFDEPFSFIDSDEDPVEVFTWESEGTTYSLAARDVAEYVQSTRTTLRMDIDDEAEDLEQGAYLSDEEMDEKTDERVTAYWHDQLDGEAEVIAVFDCHLDFLAKGFEEFVAYSLMICERVPGLRPKVMARIQEVHDEMQSYLQSKIEET